MKKKPASNIYYKKKLYVVRKYVLAKSASDALKIESKQNADDVYLEEGYKAEAIKIGFTQ